MTLEQLNILNDRRKLVVENLDFFEKRLKHFRDKVHEYEDDILIAQNLIESIDFSLMEHLEEETPVVTAFNCTDGRNRSTIMLKIEIKGIDDPIYKVLDPLDYSLYLNDDTMVDEMVLRNRLVELALAFLKKEGKLSSSFERISRNFTLAPDHFVKSTLTLKRLEHRCI